MNQHPFTGWLKERGGLWRRVCAARTWEGCWDRLLAVRPQGDSCEKQVTATGRHPNHRRRPR